MNARYVIATSTHVDVGGIDEKALEKVSESDYFTKDKKAEKGKSEEAFFKQGEKAEVCGMLTAQCSISDSYLLTLDLLAEEENIWITRERPEEH